MAGQNCKYRVFLSALEPSADAHCAGLVTALRRSGRNIECLGIGGPKMADAGCELLENTVSKAAMTYNAFAHLRHFYRLIKRIKLYLKTNTVDLVVVCDSPAFNFNIAKAAKKLRIPTLFYVAPQLWAWAPWRIGKLRKYCDKLCCILPFEQNWFASRRVDTTFVGNPLFDELEISISASPRRKFDHFNADNAEIAIMPGSRAAEIRSLWQPMQQVAAALKKNHKNIKFTTVALDETTRQILETTRLDNFKCAFDIGSVYQTARKSDLALVASGSATLQVAAAGCPMVVMYNSNRLLWHLIGRWLITTKYLSLVNILAQYGLVPELMPHFGSVCPISARSNPRPKQRKNS